MSHNQEKWIGICFILAAVSSIVGLKMYDPILMDNNFLTEAFNKKNQIIFGAINELILAVSASFTGVLLFSYLKKANLNYAISYLVFRLLEVVFILMGMLSILAVLSIGMITTNEQVNTEVLYLLGKIFIEIHDWTFILGPNFMLGINTLVYSIALYRLQIIPNKLSILGIVSAVLIFITSICELFGLFEQLSIFGIVAALPIALFEMTFAIYLISKGFIKY